MKIWICASVVLSLALSSCTNGVRPRDLSPAQAVSWVERDRQVQVLDVRSLEEYAGGHLEGAILVPWGETGFVDRALGKLDPKRPVLVYCRSGRRSSLAAVELAQNGYADVRSLEGGILAWQAAGETVITEE